MFNVKSIDEAFEIMEENFAGYCLDSEVVDIKEALGRIVAENVPAREYVPAFDRSSVDGYAVIASDTFGASDSLPAQLTLINEVSMGNIPSFVLEKGQSSYIPTGGAIPPGADAVVMIEYTENYNDGYINIGKSAAPGNNIVFKGDDIKPDDIVIKSNKRLRSQDIGALAAMGYTEISVKTKIKAGIISTGDEVIGIGEILTGAKVRDVNSYTIHAGLLDYGCDVCLYGIVKDDYEKIKERVITALEECDIVLVSGGSSVGEKDETFKVINSIGKPGVLIHGLAVKPGKPTIIGRLGTKAVIGLPGHPASAFVIFRIIVCHLIDVMRNNVKHFSNTVRARLACNYPSNNGREEFLPVRLDDTGGVYIASPLFGKSGLITLLSSADGLVWVKRGMEGLPAGQEVDVVLF